ncbi:unnamed protein product, partial [Oppiella nova]
MSQILITRCFVRFHYFVNSVKYLSFGTQIMQKCRLLNTLKEISKTTLKTKQCLSRSDNKVSTNTPKHLWCWDIITGLLLWLGVIEEPEDPLILTIKR